MSSPVGCRGSGPPGGRAGRRIARRPPVATGAVIERDVPGETRPLQLGAERSTRFAERLREKSAGKLERVEGPEAVHNPDPEAVRQERSVPAAPLAILGQVAAQA